MENFISLMGGFETVLRWEHIWMCFFGSVLGIIVGTMPGIGAMSGTALLLPLTFAFHPTAGIILLGTFYFANMYGAANSSILLNIPGDSSAIMAAMDGYPMATKKKRPGQALMVQNFASWIGGFIGILFLTFIGPPMARIGLRFGPAEMTALLLLALTSVGWLMGENPIKGVLATLLGVLIATIGMDPLIGLPRYSFGSLYLMGGIPFIPFVIGAIGFSQVMQLMEVRYSQPGGLVKTKLTILGSMPNKNEMKRLCLPSVRGGLLGSILGVVPGAGATTASFMGYSFQKAFKSEEPLGTGAVEGIASPEAANSGASAGSFAPLLALGVPGSGTTAVLLGGLLMWGLNPGPLLFTQDPDFAWGLIASLYVANVIALTVSALTVPILIKVLTVPIHLLIPSVTIVCIVGSYAVTNSMYGVLVMLSSGLLGYLLVRNNFPLAPMLLAFVLTPMLETNMRRAFVSAHGDPMIFLQRPISLALLLATCFIIFFPLFKSLVMGFIRKKKGGHS